MATGPQFVALLSALIGMHPATLDRYLRDLGDAGLIRRSGKGGGKAAVHLLMQEFISIILSLAAIHPSGAAEAVKALADLRVEGSDTLRIVLGGAVTFCAAEIIRGTSGQTVHPDWSLTLCLNPAHAILTGAPDVKHIFQSAQPALLATNTPPLMRHTVITKPLLMLVAEQCATWTENAEAPGRVSASRRA